MHADMNRLSELQQLLQLFKCFRSLCNGSVIENVIVPRKAMLFSEFPLMNYKHIHLQLN